MSKPIVPPAAPQFSRSPCQGCRRPLVWAVNKQVDASTGRPKDTRIPLDPSSAIFAVRTSNGSVICAPVREFLAIRRERIQAANDRAARLHDLAKTLYVQAINRSQPDARTLELVKELIETPPPVVQLDEDVAIYVSHFNTCSQAGRFSKQKGASS